MTKEPEQMHLSAKHRAFLEISQTLAVALR